MVGRKITPRPQEAFRRYFSCSERVRNASRQTQTRSDLPTESTINADERASAASFPAVAKRRASDNSFAIFASFAVPQESAQAGKISIVSSTEFAEKGRRANADELESFGPVVNAVSMRRYREDPLSIAHVFGGCTF